MAGAAPRARSSAECPHMQNGGCSLTQKIHVQEVWRLWKGKVCLGTSAPPNTCQLKELGQRLRWHPLWRFTQPAPSPFPSLDTSQEMAGQRLKADKWFQQGQPVPFCCPSQKTFNFPPCDDAARTTETPWKFTAKEG